MVSVGTQNDTGLTAAPSASKDKSKVKAHTLICMDAAIQTGKWSSVANVEHFCVINNEGHSHMIESSI